MQFQFQYGAIKTQADFAQQAAHADFNSNMVRLRRIEASGTMMEV